MYKICILTLLLMVSNIGFAEDLTLYLVRHAEKASNNTDPSLTARGKERAQHIAKQLRVKNVTHVFSTPYTRTRQTATPTAQDHLLKIEEYNPRDSQGFAEKLRSLQGTILVVGHSNTIPQLVGVLSGEKFESLNENTYDRLYRVTYKNGKYTGFSLSLMGF